MEQHGTFMLEIVTPERIALSEEVQFLVVPAFEGELGVLMNHAPMVAGLQVGVLRYMAQDGQWAHMAISGGFIEVIDNDVKVLVETSEHGTEIDILRAKQAKDRAEKRLAEREDQISYTRAQLALARAMARIKAAQAEKSI
ncbi:MAG: F0F1 ATP synthase subunit epsilon [Solirubrobacterales bacterium]